MQSSLNVLYKEDSFRRFFIARFQSSVGTWYNEIAVLQLVYLMGGRARELGVLMALRAAASVVSSVTFGPYIDSHDRTKILIYADCIRGFLALGFIAASFAHSLMLVFATAALLSGFDAVAWSAGSAIIPSIVTPADRGRANGLLGASFGVTTAIGAATGGVVASFTSPAVCFALNAATFFVSAYLISPLRVRHSTHTPQSSVLVSATAGIAFARKSAIITSMILVAASWGLAGAAYYVAIPLLSNETYKWGATGVGLLYAIDGVGVAFGGLVAQRLLSTALSAAVAALGVSYIVQGSAIAMLGYSPSIALAGLAVLLMRTASGIITPSGTHILQDVTPDTIQGRVFSLYYLSFMGVMPIGYAFAAIAIPQYGVRPALVVAGGISALCGCAYLLLLRTQIVTGDAGPRSG